MDGDSAARRPRIGAAQLLAVLLLVALVAASIPAVRHWRERPPAPPPATRLAFTAPAGTDLGAGDDTLDAAISPDGTAIAFVATADGRAGLWLRMLAEARARMLPGTEGARLPAWKPTGRVLAFFAAGRLKQVSIDDAVVRDLGEATEAVGASWQADGSMLLGNNRGPVRRLRNGVLSDVTTLQPGDRAHVFPAPLAAAKFIYVAIRHDGRRSIRLADGAAGGADADPELTPTSAHGVVAAGRLLYVRDDVLLAQALDMEAGTVTGRAVPIASAVGVSASGHGSFTASERLVVTAPGAARTRALAWYGVDGRRTGTIGEAGNYWQVALAPNDEDAAVTTLDPLLRTLDVIVLGTAARSTPQQLSLALAADSDPVWSEDGTRVLFRSLQDGVPNIYARRVHAPDAMDEPVLRSELDETPSDWRDGMVLFHSPGKGTGMDVWAFDATTREVSGMAASGFNESDGRWSGDGRFVAYVSDESGRPDIYAAAVPGGERLRVSFGGGTRPRWSRKGDALFFIRDDQIMRADRVAGGFATPLAIVSVPGVRDFAVAHRTDRLLLLEPVQRPVPVEGAAIVDWASVLQPAADRR